MSGNDLGAVVRSLRPRTSVRGRPIERATLEDRMAELRVPSVSVAVLENEPVSAAWGASTETLFQAASISKPVTGVATARLVAEGVIDLDANVNDILRSWQLPNGDGVTVRRLLSHTAGLSVHGFAGYERNAAVPTVVQILDGAPPANSDPVRVVRPPGEAFQYSGGGYTVLQLLLADVTREPFADFMRRVVLDPLGMNSSTYEQPLPIAQHSLAATGHGVDGTPVTGDWHVYPEQAAAGLWTTPVELVRVAGEMIEPGRILDASIRDAMLEPVIAGSFGLGWGLEPPYFEHGGSNAGFQCLLYGSVTHEKAAAVMTNSDAGATLCAEMMATIAEVFGWPDFLREREAIELDDATLNAMTGDYELQPEAVISIRREGDTLLSFAPGIPKRETFASSPTRLFRTDFDIEFDWTPDALTLNVSGLSMPAPRRREDA